jgi:gamma-glutamylcysteine synthetase
MAKKETKQVEEVQTPEPVELSKPVEVTHYSYSMINNPDESFSVIKIGFNPVEKYVQPLIEVVETNTDKYIIQERLSILLLDMESQ